MNTLQNIKYFFINIYKFRRELSEYRSWDSEHNLNMFTATLKDLRYNMEKYSNEVSKDLNKKLADIDRFCELVDNQVEDNFAERCGFDNNFSFEFKDAPGIPFIGKRMLTTGSEAQEKNNDKAIEDGIKLEEKEHKELTKLFSKFRGWWY